MKTYVFPLICAALMAGCSGIPENPEITQDELFQHLSYLRNSRKPDSVS
jgi:hypothetical protein